MNFYSLINKLLVYFRIISYNRNLSEINEILYDFPIESEVTTTPFVEDSTDSY